MEIKIEKNGVTVTITNVEDLVCKNDIPKLVEEIFDIGDKIRKNTVYGKAYFNSKGDDFVKYRLNRFVSDLIFEDKLTAETIISIAKNVLSEYGFITIDEFCNIFGKDTPSYSEGGVWGWSNLSNASVYMSSINDQIGYRIQMPCIVRKDG